MSYGAFILQSGEIELTVPTQLLWRQVHPNWYLNGRVLGISFRPTPKDEMKLSTRTDGITAKEAYLEHTEDLGLKSSGTWAISVGEVIDLLLRAIDDSTLTGRPKSHAFVDFRGAERKAVEIAARILADRANERGCVYRPLADDPPD